MTWINPSCREAFKTGNPKSKTRGSNSNPAKVGYIFGNGCKFVLIEGGANVINGDSTHPVTIFSLLLIMLISSKRSWM